MKEDVADYKGLKYSIQPHGLKTRLWVAFASFVVAFGGALLAAVPAEGAEPVATSSPADSPSPTPTPAPSPTPDPIVTVTVTRTVVVTKTVYITKTKIETVTQVVAAPTQQVPTLTPDPTQSVTSSSDAAVLGDSPSVLESNNSGTKIGVIVVWVAGLALIVLGLVGLLRRRRYQGAHHATGDPSTTWTEEHDMSDYGPRYDEYDPILGGYAGKTYQADQETEEIPPVS